MPASRSVHLALFALAASLGVVFALLAQLQDAVGFGDATLGLIAGSAFFSSVASQLWLAPLADRGRARHLMVGALLLAAAASVWFAFASTVIELILARVLAGIGVGAFQPAARAIVAAADPARAGERLGRLTAVETAGFVGGPALGAAVYELVGLEGPFLVLAALLVAAIPGVARMALPELTFVQTERRLAVVRSIVRRRQAVAAVLFGAALFLPAGMYEAIWARFLEDLGASTLFVGLSLGLYGIPFALMAALSGRHIDRLGTSRTVSFALVVIVPLTILYGQLTSPWLLVGLATIEALGNGAGLPASQAAMARATREGEHATGQGLVAAASQIGAGVAALAAGPLYAGPGPEVLFVLAAAMVALLGGLGLWLARTPEPAPTVELVQP